ncbi:MAG: hypothetical protein COV35_00020 [Alphaproteobacteria bacterium CG11_big_fil_rev_8_21_14_0_20_39_49]|nr:MAG: hypothetical protein COV35_00020 [Alphaproteobacteria bacterium CG11_big_fil_rev_8_21_14_0_20_39_49]
MIDKTPITHCITRLIKNVIAERKCNRSGEKKGAERENQVKAAFFAQKNVIPIIAQNPTVAGL